jgi:hypothetical protein
MSDVEQIYALFVEANPVIDPESLSETYQEARATLHAVPTKANGADDDSEPSAATSLPSDRSSNRRTALIAAAVAIAVVGAATMFLRSSTDAAPPATGPSTPTTQAFVPVTPLDQATTFIDRLDAHDVDGAIELLADPLGNIWFRTQGQVTDSDSVSDYLDFYLATGTTTQLSDCTSELSGPRTIVTCQANQQSEIHTALGVEIPTFQMQFQVWFDGIREIEFGANGPEGMSAAYANSRFFQFRDTMLRPRGLIQESLDPIWSRTNGELAIELVADFLANGP